MSEFEPEQVADGERTGGGAQEPDAAAVAEHPAITSEADLDDSGSIAETESVAAAGPQVDVHPAGRGPEVQAESVAAAGPQVDADTVDADPAEAEPRVKTESPVAAALAELDGLADRPVADHPDIYGRAHAQLNSALTAIDDA